MKAILRATAILGSSSAVSVLAGVATAKVNAITLGPAGLGYLALLQSLLSLSVLTVGFGVGAGVVQMAAKALAAGDQIKAKSIELAGIGLTFVLGVLGFSILVLFKVSAAKLILGDGNQAGDVVWVGAGLLLSLFSGILVSILNAHRQIGALAKIGVVNAILGAIVTVALVLWGGASFLPYVVVGTSGSSAIVSLLFYQRLYFVGGRTQPLPSLGDVSSSALELLRFGGPFTLSMLIGSGVQMLIPILVMQEIGQDSVGFYRAATAIASQYLVFLLTAMSQDYHPRVAATIVDPNRLALTINDQYRFLLLVSTPVIFATLGFGIWLVPMLYSSAFLPSLEVMRLQLIGDFFKLASWTLSYVVLVSSAKKFFYIEAMGGITILSVTWAGLQAWGLIGAGVGYLIGYLVYYVASWLVIRRLFPFRWDRVNVKYFSWAGLAACILLGLDWSGYGECYVVFSMVFATVFGVISFLRIKRALQDDHVLVSEKGV